MKETVEKYLYDPVIGRMVLIVIGVAILWTVVKIVQRKIFNKIQENTQRYKAKKATTFVGYFLTILLISVVFSEKLGGLTVALGVAGAGIAFALQEVIASVAGWLAVMFGGFYHIGDRVQLGGIKGDVIDIGVLRTTIMEMGNWVDGDLYNGRIVRVANSFVFKEPVYNYSSDFAFLWDEMKIPIDMTSDHEMTKNVISKVVTEVVGEYSDQAGESWKQMVSKFMIEDASTQPMITRSFDQNWVTYTVRYPVDFKKRRTTKDLIFSKLLQDVAASEGKVIIASSASFNLDSIPNINLAKN